MRYTRYNYKAPKKNNNFIIVITLILIVAIALGTIFAKLLPNNSKIASADNKVTKISLQKDTKTNKVSVDDSKDKAQNDIKEYVALQCGVFSKMESALILKKSLAEYGTPFIVVEDKLNKVLLGVYPKGGADSIIKQLTAKKITYSKINFQLEGKDLTSAQTNEMISADIEILNKLSEKDTKSIQTVKLKKWMTTLTGADTKNKSYASMTTIKSYLTALPEEVNKDKTEDGYIYIYKFIKKLI
ncbi:hypothetical protein [Clostridium estertheticum]|uniref:SPOR domain-containing protein n=1 Tax=Clostridium estertheticum subsp. estertheticum TaxID=1552 RepID=A0A1J0GKE0_9CLOT|nr:hypothetical protein [Clostridium estertheticum]APC41350.1 hypothetical protein A7L45_15315 [Clostridium estertheticum subsp. estertheticum]MBU3072973.1 hypothetical protein [Clostridium estertheticum]MBU3162990.1 hypothetical protein [Clostridium estertheticum]MBU3172783.1 hypothetical protein [Clostridium estertheticum]MBZ9616810.1 hypothetical protein [Clostridium estertheticum subsp. laramiense]